MYNGQQPIFILKEGTTRTSGKTAQSNNIAAAKAVSDAVRSTLGPKGMDKMLVDAMGDVVITNDGATILKEMDIEHPAAKMIIEIAKTQEQHCFDGTTSAVVIAGELLKRSEDLVEQNVHPTVICEGFRLASDKAAELIDSHALDVNEERLHEVAVTALTGKSAGAVRNSSQTFQSVQSLQSAKKPMTALSSTSMISKLRRSRVGQSRTVPSSTE